MWQLFISQYHYYLRDCKFFRKFWTLLKNCQLLTISSLFLFRQNNISKWPKKISYLLLRNNYLFQNWPDRGSWDIRWELVRPQRRIPAARRRTLSCSSSTVCDTRSSLTSRRDLRKKSFYNYYNFKTLWNSGIAGILK